MLKNFRFSWSTALIYFSATLALCCFLLRCKGVFSLIEPRHVVTSGFEEESLFAMWKYLHQQPVYTFPTVMPFAASYFNWFFYESYGSFIALVTHYFHLPEEWIPTIGRAFTCIQVILGVLLTTILFKEQDKKSHFALSTHFCFSILLWASPLIGFWAMTVRPDILGILFDIGAVYFLLRFIDKKPLLAVLLAALACYLSWSCKQINVVMPLTIGLFLLWQKQLKLFFTFSFLLIFGYALTLFLASSPMLKMIFFIDTSVPLSWGTLKNNLFQFVKKTSGIGFLFAIIFYYGMRNACDRKRLFSHVLFRLGLCGLIAWTMILLPASSKIGSAENYYFLVPFFLMFIFVAGCSEKILSPLRQNVTLISASGLFITTYLAAFNLGITSSLNEQHHQNLALKACLSELKPPLFVINHYGALPWMNNSFPTFVLAYNYWSDRQAGVRFEKDGIGGLINRRYFHTLLLPRETYFQFDEGDLQPYHQHEKLCANYVIYERE